MHFQHHKIFGPPREKTCHNKVADQPSQTDQHPCYSLFGTYHISKLATGEISILSAAL